MIYLVAHLYQVILLYIPCVLGFTHLYYYFIIKFREKTSNKQSLDKNNVILHSSNNVSPKGADNDFCGVLGDIVIHNLPPSLRHPRQAICLNWFGKSITINHMIREGLELHWSKLNNRVCTVCHYMGANSAVLFCSFFMLGFGRYKLQVMLALGLFTLHLLGYDLTPDLTINNNNRL